MAGRAFFLQLATLALALFAIDRVFAWYAPNHYIPEARLRAALAAGDRCVTLVGDSRVVAGYDAAALGQGLSTTGSSGPCSANIAIGALKVSGMAVALREYLSRGGAPRLIVVGNAADTLLAPEQPADPASFIGNEAVQLAWSRPSDVHILYPGFPTTNVLAFDQGFRFSVARSTALGTYLSIAWQKVQVLQDRAAGLQQKVNTFGALADMDAYGKNLEQAARARLAKIMAGPEAERLDRSFLEIERHARAAGARLIVVELPMPPRFQRAVTGTPEARSFRSWLAGRLSRERGILIDLSEPEWLRPEHFGDVLHLNEQGAALFSDALGHEIARFLQAGSLP
jgi:hypothetical protein